VQTYKKYQFTKKPWNRVGGGSLLNTTQSQTHGGSISNSYCYILWSGDLFVIFVLTQQRKRERKSGELQSEVQFPAFAQERLDPGVKTFFNELASPAY
jgi:hypothetical protein